jgi:hypothetical protein
LLAIGVYNAFFNNITLIKNAQIYYLIILSSSIALRYRHLIETVQPPNLWQPTDIYMSGIQRPYPAQLTNTNNSIYYPNNTIDLAVPTEFQSTNSFYPRTHISPSGTAFPPLFAYVSPSFNHHLTSTIDDNSLLIQNPSLT